MYNVYCIMYDITNEELTSVQKWVVDVVCGTNYITVVDVVAKTCYCTFTAVATQYWKLSVGNSHKGFARPKMTARFFARNFFICGSVYITE